MKQKHTHLSSKNRFLRHGLLAVALAVPMAAFVLPPAAAAQTATASLSGTVKDQTGAVIPGAAVHLRNDQSGVVSTLKANGTGFFTFAGVASGNYTVTVSSRGFKQFIEKAIHLDPGDSRTLPSVVLLPGSETTSVTVTAESDVPLDTGERSDLITAEEISHLSIEGRDVTELFKTLPGFALGNDAGGAGIATNAPAYDPSQVSVNGALGDYAANGNPLSGVTLRLDGADITDPGNYGAAIQTVNYDQVAEVKVLVSNFGADIADGPVVVSVVSKSGGDKFHGELYTYGRTSQLDSTDALAKQLDETKDPDREIYPGGEIGGPILIPGTHFNHNRTLTFFAGAEDYVQRNIYAYGNSSAALVHALVPTQDMRNGNFTTSALMSYLGDLYGNSAVSQIDAEPTIDKNGNPLATPGMIPTSLQDPGAEAIMKLFPLPNTTATPASPYNWQAQNFVNNDLWEATGRVDMAISQNNHFFGRYTVERGASGEPDAIYYNEGGLNVPGGAANTINSESAVANLTTIFTSTLTNQLFGSLGYLDSAYHSLNTSLLTSYPYQGAYDNHRMVVPSIPNYGGETTGLPLDDIPDYSLSPLFSHKFIPEGGDTVTKVWGKHTATFGVFIERITNNQLPTADPTNGELSSYYFSNAGATFVDADSSTKTLSGNGVANFEEGIVGGYQQQNILPDTNLYYWNNDFFANDSWRARQRLTVNAGMRVEHLGMWNDAYGQGLAVFEPSLIASGSSASPFPGFVWHAIDHSLPISGNSSKPAFLEPRVGFAWDVHGNGWTVLRGGWGEYRSHDSWNDVSGDLNEAQNVGNVIYGMSTLSAISGLNLPLSAGTQPATDTYPSGASGNLAFPNNYGAPGTMYALAQGDNEEPLTDTYSLTLNQQMPWKMNLLVGYVGDNSRFLLNDGSAETVALDNVNAIPIGGLYKPNPYTGQILAPVGPNVPNADGAASVVGSAGTQQVNQYRPLNTALVQYGAIDVPRHNLFSNYNGLQVGLTRETGRVMFNVNYTWSRALGIQGVSGTGYPSNPFNIWDDYGPEAFDRTNIVNASYTFEVGSPVHNRFAGAFVNGWEISGITNYQSGPDITTTLNSPGLGIMGTIGAASSPNQIAVTNTVYLGTPDVSLQPTLVCNPLTGLHGREYYNGACLGTPNLLQNGVYQLPAFRGPAYFDTDLSAQKTFQIRAEQNIQFRFSAFNFINHALPTFSGSFPTQYTLNLSNPNGTTFNQGLYTPSQGFGTTPYEIGRRVSEIMLKYNF